MEIAQPAKISMLLYMMKIVIKSDAGMHRAAFFALGRGGVTVKLGAFLGWVVQGSLENFRGQGSHFPWGQGGAGRASLMRSYWAKGKMIGTRFRKNFSASC